LAILNDGPSEKRKESVNFGKSERILFVLEKNSLVERMVTEKELVMDCLKDGRSGLRGIWE
jgi:hypothetical protein